MCPLYRINTFLSNLVFLHSEIGAFKKFGEPTHLSSYSVFYLWTPVLFQEVIKTYVYNYISKKYHLPQYQITFPPCIHADAQSNTIHRMMLLGYASNSTFFLTTPATTYPPSPPPRSTDDRLDFFHPSRPPCPSTIDCEIWPSQVSPCALSFRLIARITTNGCGRVWTLPFSSRVPRMSTGVPWRVWRVCVCACLCLCLCESGAHRGWMVRWLRAVVVDRRGRGWWGD